MRLLARPLQALLPGGQLVDADAVRFVPPAKREPTTEELRAAHAALGVAQRFEAAMKDPVAKILIRNYAQALTACRGRR